MARTTKIVGISLPPDLHRRLETELKKTSKTRSEFYRYIIENYLVNRNDNRNATVSESDLADILKLYWDLKTSTDLKIIIIGLGVIYDSEKGVLIGLRRLRDDYVDNLSWVFPGGRFKTLDFEPELKAQVKKEANLDVEVKSLVSARIHPDSGFKQVQIIALYFDCRAVNGNDKPGGDLVELQWVKPLDVFKYFTTSTSDEITKHLTMLERSQNF